MGVSDWNWRAPVELQNVPWDCAAASLAWCLQAMGLPYTEADVVLGLGPSRISPTYGLLDASGAGLVEYLAELGIPAFNNPDASWDDIEAAAGYQPMLIGGRAWNHWSGVRIGKYALEYDGTLPIALANPAPGWGDVDQLLYVSDVEMWGPWSAVVLNSSG